MSRFSRHIDKLAQAFEERPEKAEFQDQIREVVLSNLYRLFPGISLERMMAEARLAFFNQNRASIEVGYFPELVPQIEVKDQSGFSWTENPSIYVSYHIAGYRLLPAWLLCSGVPLTIVMDKKVAENKEVAFSGALSNVLSKAGLNPRSFKFRDTSDPALILNLVRDLRSGQSVLFYIDGNMGIDGIAASAAHTQPVEFLGHKLLSRIGIPVISLLARTPIIPAIMQRTSRLTVNKVLLHPAIHPALDRSEHVKHSLSEIWRHCEEIVRVDPGSWESLRYINKYVSFRPLKSDSYPIKLRGDDKIIFNHRRFSFRDDFDETVVFDRQRGLLFTIGDRIAPYLKALQEVTAPRPLSRTDMPHYVANWMLEKGIIERAS